MDQARADVASCSPSLPVGPRHIAALDALVAYVKDLDALKDGPPEDFGAFERSVRQRFMEAERAVIAAALAKADIDVAAIEVGGVKLRRVLRSTDTYMTAAGPVQVTRTLYKDRTQPDSKSVCPMELRAGIVESMWTPDAAKLAAWVVSQVPAGVAEELFERMGNMAPSKSSLDRLPKQLLARTEPTRDALDASIRADEAIPEGTTTVAVSLDGVMAPMKDGDAVAKRSRTAARGQVAKGPAGYREVGCGALSFYDKDGNLLRVIRMARMPETKKVTLKSILEAELSPILRARPDIHLVKVADGAKDNWDFLVGKLPEGIEVLDFYHAAEHLSDALGAAYGDGSVQARAHFDMKAYILRHQSDGADVVIRALAALAKKNPKSQRIAKVLGYFRANRKRMRYAELAAKNLPIGSGIVEAACKTLVAQRLKLSGMRWSVEGGQAILNLRGWQQSQRFDKAWALIAAKYKVEVVALGNVIDLDQAREERRQ